MPVLYCCNALDTSFRIDKLEKTSCLYARAVCARHVLHNCTVACFCQTSQPSQLPLCLLNSYAVRAVESRPRLARARRIVARAEGSAYAAIQPCQPRCTGASRVYAGFRGACVRITHHTGSEGCSQGLQSRNCFNSRLPSLPSSVHSRFLDLDSENMRRPACSRRQESKESHTAGMPSGDPSGTSPKLVTSALDAHLLSSECRRLLHTISPCSSRSRWPCLKPRHTIKSMPTQPS